jgi:hypothetical protein
LTAPAFRRGFFIPGHAIASDAQQPHFAGIAPSQL